MKPVEYYLKLPYKMEIVEDTEEGDMWHHFRSLVDALRAQIRL